MQIEDSKKLIFLDIDGTIYSMTGVIPESAKKAIQKARENGHKVYLNTGRSKAELPRDILDLGYDGIVASGGAYVEADGKLIFNQFIEPELINEIYRYLYENEIIFTVETNDYIYGTKDQIQNQKMIYLNHKKRSIDRYQNEKNLDFDGTDCRSMDQGIETFIKLLTVVEDLEQVMGVNKIMFSNSKIPVEQMQREIGERMTVLPGSIDPWKRESGEMYNKKINKATGIDKIIKLLGAEQKDTIAFGDNYNDIEMIEFAGIGVAMGNAVDKLKAVADFVTNENYNDGLYYGFEFCRLL